MALFLEHKLEAHPILSNQQLLQLNVKSKGILWANFVTLLQPRSSARYYGGAFNSLDDDGTPVEESNHRKVFLCHDMMGNYREDRHYNSSVKWDDYRFYHWAGIDYFCYFSHDYITIPPVGWINAAHLHGVRVLGTFITEGTDGSARLKEILESYLQIEQTVDALVRVCQHFCFEGWLINIECPVHADKVPKLIYFINTLKRKIYDQVPNGIVIWYDSIIANGALAWQNEVNEKNISFLKASDGMLINYSWGDDHLMRTAQIVQRESRKLQEIFFGIDVFARNQIAKFRSHETLARIVRHNFSAGIFAPGWTFESLQQYNYNIHDPKGDEHVNDAFLKRNEKFWSLMWPYFVTNPYMELPFYTDFCLGSGKKTFDFGRERSRGFFNLSRQSLQPSVPLQDYAERCFDNGINGGSCLKIIKHNDAFRLFATDFALDNTMIFAYASKTENPHDQIEILLKLSLASDIYRTIYVMCGEYYGNVADEGRIFAKPLDESNFAIITRMLREKQLPIKIPFQLANGWTVRYYGLNFNKKMLVRDIGVHYKKSNPADNYKGYLGAIYLHTVNFSIKDWFSIYLA